MIVRWTVGRATIDQMIASGHLERVAADRDLADLNLSHAVAHLAAASTIIGGDAPGAFNLAYDAARKAFAAVLENQGLRVTTSGGHKAYEDALRAQLDPPLGSMVSSFGWLRVTRHATEYVTFDRPAAGADEAAQAIEYADDIIQKSQALLDQMPRY